MSKESTLRYTIDQLSEILALMRSDKNKPNLASSPCMPMHIDDLKRRVNQLDDAWNTPVEMRPLTAEEQLVRLREIIADEAVLDVSDLDKVAAEEVEV